MGNKTEVTLSVDVTVGLAVAGVIVGLIIIASIVKFVKSRNKKDDKKDEEAADDSANTDKNVVDGVGSDPTTVDQNAGPIDTILPPVSSPAAAFDRQILPLITEIQRLSNLPGQDNPAKEQELHGRLIQLEAALKATPAIDQDHLNWNSQTQG